MAGERVVLDEVLKQLKADRAPALSADEFFEVFTENYVELGASDQVAKGADLEGIVNGLSL
jgi:hypothetical protein